MKFLKQKISEKNRVLVAFSGGVDSAVVAKLAHDVLHENSLAVIVDSETFPAREKEFAEKVANEIGINFEILTFSELDTPDFTSNAPNRCYICRREIARHLRDFADKHGIETIADGVITSDLNEHRPGIKATDEAGFWHPLVDAEIDKQGVREIAKVLELSIHEKPSSACLSSRIPYGEEITAEKLELVEKAEDYIRSLGFTQVRVRNYGGTLARIEVFKTELERLLEPEIIDNISGKLKEIGFAYVTVDLEGYRSGSMDEIL